MSVLEDANAGRIPGIDNCATTYPVPFTRIRNGGRLHYGGVSKWRGCKQATKTPWAEAVIVDASEITDEMLCSRCFTKLGERRGVVVDAYRDGMLATLLHCIPDVGYKLSVSWLASKIDNLPELRSGLDALRCAVDLTEFDKAVIDRTTQVLAMYDTAFADTELALAAIAPLYDTRLARVVDAANLRATGLGVPAENLIFRAVHRPGWMPRDTRPSTYLEPYYAESVARTVDRIEDAMQHACADVVYEALRRADPVLRTYQVDEARQERAGWEARAVARDDAPVLVDALRHELAADLASPPGLAVVTGHRDSYLEMLLKWQYPGVTHGSRNGTTWVRGPVEFLRTLTAPAGADKAAVAEVDEADVTAALGVIGALDGSHMPAGQTLEAALTLAPAN